jgi:hypothetical protein
VPDFFSASVRQLTATADMYTRHCRLCLAAAVFFSALAIAGFVLEYDGRFSLGSAALLAWLVTWQTRCLARATQAHAADLNMHLAQFTSRDLVQHHLK